MQKTRTEKRVTVDLTSGRKLIIPTHAKALVSEIHTQVCQQLGLRENGLFGLATISDDELRFLEFESKIHKYGPKTWKAKQGDGCDKQGIPLITIYFRVQYYLNYRLLRDKVSRKLYYQQLRLNVLSHNQTIPEERCFQLAAFALQADFGTFNHKTHSGRYYEPRSYFPEWIIKKWSETFVFKSGIQAHKDLRGMTSSDAQNRFIKDASAPDAPHNILFYQLKKKKDDKKATLWLGISPIGLEIYEDDQDGMKYLISTFEWKDIGRLQYDRKKFQVQIAPPTTGRMFHYYVISSEWAAYLLWVCQCTHQLLMTVEPTLAQIKRLEKQASRRYRENYVYSACDLNWGPENGIGTLDSSSSTLPRTSVISQGSSATTSGIVSQISHPLSTDDTDGSEDKDRGTSVTSSNQSSPQTSPGTIKKQRICVSLPNNLNDPEPVLNTNRMVVEPSTSLSSEGLATLEQPFVDPTGVFGFGNTAPPPADISVSMPCLGGLDVQNKHVPRQDKMVAQSCNQLCYSKRNGDVSNSQGDDIPYYLKGSNTLVLPPEHLSQKWANSRLNDPVNVPYGYPQHVDAKLYPTFTVVKSVPTNVQIAHSTVIGRPGGSNNPMPTVPETGTPTHVGTGLNHTSVGIRPFPGNNVDYVNVGPPSTGLNKVPYQRPVYLNQYVNDRTSMPSGMTTHRTAIYGSTPELTSKDASRLLAQTPPNQYLSNSQTQPKKSKAVVKAYSFEHSSGNSNSGNSNLHPDLVSFRGVQSSNSVSSLPLIIGLCNDRTLLNMTPNKEASSSSSDTQRNSGEISQKSIDYSMDTMISLNSMIEHSSEDDISFLDDDLKYIRYEPEDRNGTVDIPPYRWPGKIVEHSPNGSTISSSSSNRVIQYPLNCGERKQKYNLTQETLSGTVSIA